MWTRPTLGRAPGLWGGKDHGSKKPKAFCRPKPSAWPFASPKPWPFGLRPIRPRTLGRQKVFPPHLPFQKASDPSDPSAVLSFRKKVPKETVSGNLHFVPIPSDGQSMLPQRFLDEGSLIPRPDFWSFWVPRSKASLWTGRDPKNSPEIGTRDQ